MIQPKFLLLFFYGLSLNLAASSAVRSDSLPTLAITDSEAQFQNKFYDALKEKGIENYSKAIENFVICSKLFPERSVVFYQLGDLYLKIKSYSRSESNLQKAIALDDSNFWYKEKLYQLYVAQDNFERAIEAVKPLLYKAQGYQEDLVHLYANTGQFESALEQIEILDRCFGYSPVRDQTRSNIYKQSKDQKGHINYLRKRLKSNPDNQEDFLNLIYTLSEYGLKQEAFKSSELFLKTHRKSHIPHVALYKFYLDAKAYDKAINSMKIVTASNVLAPYLKVKVLNDFVQFAKDNPAYKTALLEVKPAASLDTSQRSNAQWAAYYNDQAQWKKAAEFYDKALKEAPDDITIIKALAALYLKTKAYVRAGEFTLEKIELFPTQIELYIIYGQAQFYLERWDAALKQLELGLDYIFEENQTTATYYGLMAELYTKTNNIAQAKSFKNKVKALENND